jgi:hypothetical protein
VQADVTALYVPNDNAHSSYAGGLAVSHRAAQQQRPICRAAVAERPAPTTVPVLQQANAAAPPATLSPQSFSASSLKAALHAAWEVCYSSPDVLEGKTCLRQLLLGHWLLEGGDWRERDDGQLLLPLAEAQQVVEQQLAAAVASGVKVYRHTFLSRLYPGGEQFNSAWRKNKFGKAVFSLDDLQRPQYVILRPDILLRKAHQVLQHTGPAAGLPFAPPARLLQLLAQHPPWGSGLDVVYYLAGRQLLAPYAERIQVRPVHRKTSLNNDFRKARPLCLAGSAGCVCFSHRYCCHHRLHCDCCVWFLTLLLVSPLSSLSYLLSLLLFAGEKCQRGVCHLHGPQLAGVVGAGAQGQAP